MNRYPLWKYLLVTAVLALGLLYTLPNFFGDTLAVQISTNRHSLAIDSQTEARVAQALKTAGSPTTACLSPTARSKCASKTRKPR